MEQRYLKLKSMVRKGVEIELRDTGEDCKVLLVDHSNGFTWTGFTDSTMTKVLDRAIEKLEHPDKHYIDEEGTIWAVTGTSIYTEEHIRRFLKKGGIVNGT